MTITRTDRDETWDANGQLVGVETVERDITVDAVTFDMHNKLRALLSDAAQARQICDTIQAKQPAVVTSVATAQAATRELQQDLARLSKVTEGLVRRLVALARLTVGALDDNANT